MRAKEKRDIQVYNGGDLFLSHYRWSLKNWKGELLATEHFMVSSQGEAAKKHSIAIGRYTLSRTIVMHDDSSVYKHDGGDIYLYRDKDGRWSVGPQAGNNKCYFHQANGNHSPSPSKTLPWKYIEYGGGGKDDVTLRIFHCF